MLAQVRRNIILEALQEEKTVVVSELSKQFSVSEETIRRDLDKLEKQGFAIKSYGGATLNENVSIDLPSNIRKKHNILAKQRMAGIVANLINNGDKIAMDASSTALFIAKGIKTKENMTLVTYSLEIALELSDMPGWKVLSTGGVVRAGSLALYGPKAVRTLSSYQVDKAIFSCKGIERKNGLSDGNDEDAQMKVIMMNNAKQCILVVDASKFDKISFVTDVKFSEVDIVVTDRCPSDEWLAFFEKNNIQCLYPDSH